MTTPGTFGELAAREGRQVQESTRPIVCVQGLGFVGSAMAVAIANASDGQGNPCFDVVGVDLPSRLGRTRAAALNRGAFPIESADESMAAALRTAHSRGNLIATTSEDFYASCSIAVVDIPLDVDLESDHPHVDFSAFEAGVRTLGRSLSPGSLIVVETTVPPGTCQKVVGPTVRAELAARNLPPDALMIAHSYERVMPGDEYLASIVEMPRVFAGLTEDAADACEAFLSKVVNVARVPLDRMHSTTASETGKVLENSYRAVNIAFAEEWGRFAEAAGIDLFEVLHAIRRRPTHANIRQPGFGVGGYCLTKDPLMGLVAARQLLCRPDLTFDFSTRAVSVNRAMPLVTLRRLQDELGSLSRKRILLLGVSYRQDVSDTRFSPSGLFVREAYDKGATVTCHDPFVKNWPELELEVLADLPDAAAIDAVVLAVPHSQYRQTDFVEWLGIHRPLFFDANNVLTGIQRESLVSAGARIRYIGRGTPS
jgi:nucleotide sugar dehydrogenase